LQQKESSGVLLMSVPFLVSDLRTTLKKTYTDEQFKELDEALEGCGVNMQASRHLEIIPNDDMPELVKGLALEMSGLRVLPWCLKVDEKAVVDSCFYKVEIFGETYWMHASFYRPAAVEVCITVDGVMTGGVMGTG